MPEKYPLIAREIYDLHQLVYRNGRDIPVLAVEVGSPSAASASRYIRLMAVNQSAVDGSVIGAYLVGAETVNLYVGNPSLVHPSNHRGVFRHLLAFAFEQGQNRFTEIVGATPPSLVGKEINFKGEVHFVSGFNAQFFDTRGRTKEDLTIKLEQYFTQYLVMHMYDAFREKDPVLEVIKVHNRGVDREFIFGAEIINDILAANGVEAEDIQNLRIQSNIRGLIRLLEDARVGLGRALITACTQPSHAKSLRELRRIREKYG